MDAAEVQSLAMQLQRYVRRDFKPKFTDEALSKETEEVPTRLPYHSCPGSAYGSYPFQFIRSEKRSVRMKMIPRLNCYVAWWWFMPRVTVYQGEKELACLSVRITTRVLVWLVVLIPESGKGIRYLASTSQRRRTEPFWQAVHPSLDIPLPQVIRPNILHSSSPGPVPSWKEPL
jgi:hypothetical protein